MSGRTETHYVLTCDGCGAKVGADGSMPNAVQARAAAYAEGWRFPSGVLASGGQSTVASDVCPKCLPDWKPAVISRPRRVAS